MIGQSLLRRFKHCACAVLFGFLTARAQAGGVNDFAISPVRLIVEGANQSRVITISNQSTDQIRFSLTGYKWTQKPGDDLHLTQTDDLIFFPQIFTLGPLEQRQLRIGVTVPPAASELTYRIIVEELPPLSAVTRQPGAHVSFRLRLSVPVYVRPAHAVSQGVVRTATVRGSKIRVIVGNEGTAHFVVTKATVTARRADGSIAFSNPSSAWFVLANAEHELEIPVPAKTCAEIRSVEVRVNGDGLSFGRTVSSITPNCSK